MSLRPVKQISRPQPTLEGAGVRLQRAFGFGKTEDFDPFLLLDDFRNDNPRDYLAGFPWHPHRGIETITYVLAGTVEHGDSLGNKGLMGPGDVQWMTAGRGILHQEMPKGDAKGQMHGFQLWANLPSSLKMTQPRYQDITSKDIPSVTDDDGTTVRVIIGDFWGQRGPVEGIAADPRYLDVSVPPGKKKRLVTDVTQHAFAYVFAGSGTFRDASDPQGVLTERTDGSDIVTRSETMQSVLRNAEKAAKWAAQFGGKSAATPKEAAEGQDFVMMCVGNDNDVREVAPGVYELGGPEVATFKELMRLVLDVTQRRRHEVARGRFLAVLRRPPHLRRGDEDLQRLRADALRARTFKALKRRAQHRGRERSRRALESYGWVDQQAGAVRIPIERAIDIVAERGLPHRESK